MLFQQRTSLTGSSSHILFKSLTVVCKSKVQCSVRGNSSTKITVPLILFNKSLDANHHIKCLYCSKDFVSYYGCNYYTLHEGYEIERIKN